MKITKPDYNRSILSISSSILKNYGLKSNYNSLLELDNILSKKYRNVIFLILDCLGVNILEQNLSESSFLRKHYITSVTSVFPPTTAAATISFHSGLSPLENGWVGWMPYFKEYNCAIEAFTGKNYYTREQITKPLEKELLKYETIYDKITRKCKEIHYHKVFTSKAFENGVNSFEQLCNEIKKCCDNNHYNLISAYWHDPDYTIHRNGINCKNVKDVLNKIDSELRNLSTNLKDSVIIISADHGAVDVKDVYLNEISELDKCLRLPPTIESRFVSFFIKNGMKREFKLNLKKHFKDQYIIYTKNQFLKSGLLGTGKQHNRINDYIGDYVVIVYGDINLLYSIDNNKSSNHYADHGGITKEEMVVPLIAIDCNNL